MTSVLYNIPTYITFTTLNICTYLLVWLYWIALFTIFKHYFCVYVTSPNCFKVGITWIRFANILGHTTWMSKHFAKQYVSRIMKSLFRNRAITINLEEYNSYSNFYYTEARFKFQVYAKWKLPHSLHQIQR